MFWKLAACVLCMGILGCALLSMRQARLQAAHELAQTQLRIRTCDERLFKLRAEIGRNIRPDEVRSMVSDMAALKPITPPRAVAKPNPKAAPDAKPEVGPGPGGKLGHDGKPVSTPPAEKKPKGPDKKPAAAPHDPDQAPTDQDPADDGEDSSRFAVQDGAEIDQ